MIYNKNAAARLLGVLFKNPERLSNTDKYMLSTNDFADLFHRIVFGQIDLLYQNGMVKLTVEGFIKELSRFPDRLATFKKNEGEDFLVKAVELDEDKNFDFYYAKVKKMSLLRELKEVGFDVSDWYCDDMMDLSRREVLELKLEDASLQTIIDDVQNKFLDVESKFINKKTFDIGTAASDIEETLRALGEETALGLPINGERLSTIILGARKKKVMSLSGESGSGKSRYAVANACKLAYPILWDIKKGRWTNSGSNQKIIFITTELTKDEIQTIMLAFVSGVDEEKILTKNLSESEQKRVSEAVNIIFNFEENFYIYHLPDPNVAQLRVNLKRYIYRFKVDAIFFDYIHTSPNLLSEFSGAKIREDVALMLLSTALKNIANEHNVFVWTGTQINGSIAPGAIAGVETIRGSRAIMDKVDAAMVLRAVAPEDLKLVAMLSQQTGRTPTHSIDIFKNRRGKHNKVRLWIALDLGTVRAEELFLTDQYGGLISMDIIRTVDSEAMYEDIVPLYKERVEKEPEERSSFEMVDLELDKYSSDGELPLEGEGFLNLKISL